MTDILYALISIICAIMLEILLNRVLSMRNEGQTEKQYSRLLLVSFLFCIVDAVWGLEASHTLHLGVIGLTIGSFMFHSMAALVAFEWMRYVCKYLESDKVVMQTSVGLALFVSQLVLLVVNFRSGIIFTVDASCEYHVGEYRYVLFLLQYMNYVYAAILTVGSYLKQNDAYVKKRCGAVLVFAIVPVVSGIFQMMYPNAPFYAIGYMLAATIIFIYNVSSEHEHMLALENEMTKLVSKQNRETINALAKVYTSVSVINLEIDKYRAVQHDPMLDEFIGEEDSASIVLQKMVLGLVNEKQIESTLEFVNLATLSRRMVGKDAIAHEFRTEKRGWCRCYFIRSVDGENGQPLNVVFAVEVIDEEKRREIEYQQALAKALENQNEVYAEMLQMQSNGIIATDKDNKIIKLNDAAARMFGYPSSDNFDGDLQTLIDMSENENKDRLIQSFTALKTIGGRISYEFSICSDGLNRIYIMATSNLAVMTSGEKIIITSLTNITKSKCLERELTQMSETDALTGIRNRGSGERRITSAIEEGIPGMFALMDVDKFKTINDTFGHGVGDKVLIAIAQCLTKSFRGQDIVMRLGGDEFAVYAVGVVKPDTMRLCIERLFDEIDRIDIEEMRGSGRKVSISLGAIVCDGTRRATFDELYQQADNAMYSSKRVEGNHYGTNDANTPQVQ